MPVYKDPRIIKKVSIPTIEGGEVELWNTILWGDLEKIYELEGSDAAKGVKALVFLIKDWNLTNEKKEKLPIDESTIRSFTPDVVAYLLSQTDFGKKGIEDLKKKTI